MSSKLKYLKRYGHKKATRKVEQYSSHSHLHVVDDDVNWRSIVPEISENLESDDNSDEAPLVAEVKDESRIKWQPLSMSDDTEILESCAENDRNAFDKQNSNNLQKGRGRICENFSPPRRGIGSPSQSNVRHGNQKARSSHKEGDLRKKHSIRVNSEDGSDSSPPRKHAYKSKTTEDEPKVEKISDTVCRNNEQEFFDWGRGIVQTSAAANKEQDEAHEMLKPLARYVDDEDLEKMLKERKRDGDPMLMFMKSSKTVLKKKLHKEKPQYKGNSSPNRYGIQPGYRWDGVDRSNGFEKAWFAKSADRKAIADESYKWSVEDM